MADINEGPINLTLAGGNIAENAAGAIVGQVSASDVDAGDTLTYAVSDGRFQVIGGQLQLKDGVSLDHEAEPNVTLTLTATDQGGLATSKTVSLNVTDINEGPVNLTLAGGTIAEYAAGAIVGQVSASDVDAGDTLTYAVSDDRFQVVGGQLQLKDGVSLDHEAEPHVTLTLTATDQGGLATSKTVTLNVADVNEGPVNLTLAGGAIAENAAGAIVGQVSAADPDAGDTLTYAVSDDRFQVVGGQLQLKDGVSLDHEAEPNVTLTLTATDQGGLATTKAVTLNVADVNEGPVSLALAGGNIAENAAGAVVGAISASDPDAGDTAHLYVSDDRFQVVGGQLQLKDGVSLDHEAEAHVTLTLTATDSGGLVTSKTATINVQDINEGPVNLTLAGSTIAENAAGAVVGAVSASDPDAGDTLTYTVSDNRFQVVGGQLQLKDGVSLDHEAEPNVTLTLTATDQGGLATSKTVTLNVADVNEGPVSLTLAGGAIAENAAGAIVRQLSATRSRCRRHAHLRRVRRSLPGRWRTAAIEGRRQPRP